MSDLPKKKLLIVEDNETLAKMYETHFSLSGFEVKRVGDGELALSTAIEFQPDLIILDVLMPKINGFDVLDTLHTVVKTAHIPVIMLTALSEQVDKDRAKQLGADDYFVKTEVDLPALTKKIQEKLSSSI